jgi:hypothetical protein
MGLYDDILADERARIATEAAGLPKGSGTVYLAAQGGERMAQGARSMFGIEEPAVTAHKEKEAKQQLLNTILQKYSSMNTKEDYTNAINELFANGFTEHAAKVQEMMANLPEDEKERELTTKEVSMDMAAEFVQCAIDAGGWRKADQACKAEVFKKYTALNRQTSAEAGFIEGAKLSAQAVHELQTKIYLDAGNARDSLYSINQSIDLLDDVYSGSAGEGLSNFKKFMVSIGFASKDENMSEEMYRRNSMQAVTQWIQKTKGSISDKEMDAFIDASPGLKNTKAGNLLILQTMKNWAQFQSDLAVEWNRWFTEADKVAKASGIPVSEVEWETHLHHWYNTSGKKPKAPTAAQIQAALEDDGNANNVNNEVQSIYKYEVGQ